VNHGRLLNRNYFVAENNSMKLSQIVLRTWEMYDFLKDDELRANKEHHFWNFG
jgi:hypothetical protein